ncbi:unnamed protein product [Gulo gulo]|uniref:Uncharacterized protein n=1 Tax=Gulo gulo TaxID=48420 RepID=A0A9X9LPF1_GULGU|nr:unnamed protein product [Gulo gulo]
MAECRGEALEACWGKLLAQASNFQRALPGTRGAWILHGKLSSPTLKYFCLS